MFLNQTILSHILLCTVFKTEWLDIDWEERFNSVISGKISYLKGLIERVEATVVEHKKNLKKYSDMTFDDVKHIIED